MNEIFSYLGIHLSETLLLMRKFLANEFETNQVGMRFEEWVQLIPLMEKESLNQKTLSDRLAKDKTTISRLVDGWVKKGWVKRIQSNEDKRSFSLKLTTKGKSIWEKGIPVVKEADLVFKKNLSEENEKELFVTLFKIQTSIQFSETKNVPY
ncbi:MarR family winged helix-turn-helix transcriptional regulator [Leptospira levettii]|uniref:MarR family transcriptional regulator n=1 Tax=Leptospira levettii TaxID=2023178 RepID=A0ABY2MNA1_9LEPT|nr:MarR family transcriptional regulator [Leptospira levettii]TGL70127.1 MarR family transcriptional regulator [Leptospira levettii]TGM28728.1 MarR family transcriptional regulator [Leptospira levettii]TGM32641.1 MarR family transcriptional regulator [Leptospira levettii]TGM83460.1 MarR family transcriptional regulator [Leptospira levettii]TGM93354.1 MarR family transcriptional regulator [Leptospira levettii]